jgi:hypothetical protein
MGVINDPSKYFYASNGAVLKSLQELQEFLQEVDYDTFVYHVNSGRNDFANWVNDVLKKKVLSKKLRKAKNRREMISLIYAIKKKTVSKNQQKNIVSKLKEVINHG